MKNLEFPEKLLIVLFSLIIIPFIYIELTKSPLSIYQIELEYCYNKKKDTILVRDHYKLNNDDIQIVDGIGIFYTNNYTKRYINVCNVKTLKEI